MVYKIKHFNYLCTSCVVRIFQTFIEIGKLHSTTFFYHFLKVFSFFNAHKASMSSVFADLLIVASKQKKSCEPSLISKVRVCTIRGYAPIRMQCTVQ